MKLGELEHKLAAVFVLSFSRLLLCSLVLSFVFSFSRLLVCLSRLGGSRGEGRGAEWESAGRGGEEREGAGEGGREVGKE